MDNPEEQAIQRISELFERCRIAHRQAYPSSALDFDLLNITNQVTCHRKSCAKGNFSDVYKGMTNSGRMVAVKTLRLPEYDRYNDKVYRDTILRFFRELTHWCHLDHINVARMIGYTLADGNISFVSLWCPSGNLPQYLNRYPSASKRDLILDVAEGVHYLHTCQQPLIHGDLKGANVLVDENGIARIADFGISKQMDDLNRKTGFTTTSGVTGPTPWMAPELLKSLKLASASDVYSCAGVFLEIACPGKYPYHYLDATGVVLAKTRGELPQRTQYAEMIEQDALWYLMGVCWDNEPQKRPDMGTVVQALYEQFELGPRVVQSVATRPVKLSTVEATEQEGLVPGGVYQRVPLTATIPSPKPDVGNVVAHGPILDEQGQTSLTSQSTDSHSQLGDNFEQKVASSSALDDPGADLDSAWAGNIRWVDPQPQAADVSGAGLNIRMTAVCDSLGNGTSGLAWPRQLAFDGSNLRRFEWKTLYDVILCAINSNDFSVCIVTPDPSSNTNELEKARFATLVHQLGEKQLAAAIFVPTGPKGSGIFLHAPSTSPGTTLVALAFLSSPIPEALLANIPPQATLASICTKNDLQRNEGGNVTSARSQRDSQELADDTLATSLESWGLDINDNTVAELSEENRARTLYLRRLRPNPSPRKPKPQGRLARR